METKPEPTPRLRGHKGAEQRARRRAQEPLCRHCKAKGLVTPATVIDHIVPLHKGGPDTDCNTQPLCKECHDIKTRSDMGYRERPAIGLDGWPA